MKNYRLKTQIFLMAFMLGLFNYASAQSINWNWLSQTSGVGGETSQGAVTDAQGNVYHAGSFTGSFTIEGTTVQSWGGPLATNGYVSRYTPSGPASNNWTLVVGSKGNNTPLGNIRGLCVDVAGNTYFWYYEFNVNFSGDTIQIGPNHHWLKPPPLGIMSLLIKVDPQGNVAWFKPFHHTGAGLAEPIYTATNSQGDLYIAGGFPSSLTLDTISLSNGGIL
jgi:hypothetical protein